MGLSRCLPLGESSIQVKVKLGDMVLFWVSWEGQRVWESKMRFRLCSNPPGCSCFSLARMEIMQSAPVQAQLGPIDVTLVLDLCRERRQHAIRPDPDRLTSFSLQPPLLSWVPVRNNYFKVEVTAAPAPRLDVRLSNSDDVNICPAVFCLWVILLDFSLGYIPFKHPKCSECAERSDFPRSQWEWGPHRDKCVLSGLLWWWPADHLAQKWAKAGKETLGRGMWAHYAFLLLCKVASSL